MSAADVIYEVTQKMIADAHEQGRQQGLRDASTYAVSLQSALGSLQEMLAKQLMGKADGVQCAACGKHAETEAHEDSCPVNIGLAIIEAALDPVTEIGTIPVRCPRCNSPSPKKHPALQCEGEVQPCPDPWHNNKEEDIGTVPVLAVAHLEDSFGPLTSPAKGRAEWPATDCRTAGPGKGLCDMCAAGHYEKCRYARNAVCNGSPTPEEHAEFWQGRDAGKFYRVPWACTPKIALAGAQHFKAYLPINEANVRALIEDVATAWEDMVAVAASETPQPVLSQCNGSDGPEA